MAYYNGNKVGAFFDGKQVGGFFQDSHVLRLESTYKWTIYKYISTGSPKYGWIDGSMGDLDPKQFEYTPGHIRNISELYQFDSVSNAGYMPYIILYNMGSNQITDNWVMALHKLTDISGVNGLTLLGQHSSTGGSRQSGHGCLMA